MEKESTQFNPHNYKSHEELPEDTKEEFTKDGDGFVKREVTEYENKLKDIAKESNQKRSFSDKMLRRNKQSFVDVAHEDAIEINSLKNPSEKIWYLAHAIDPKFWVPAIDNRQIEEFVKFVLKNNLQDKFKAYDQNSGKDFNKYIVDSCHEIQKDFWVPASDGQIGNFIEFCDKHNLWEKFREII